MKSLLLFSLFSFAAYAAPVTPEAGLAQLVEGNARFVSSQLLYPNRGEERRNEVVNQQKPFAIILSCSDSRVVPEIIFDQGIGDLFVVRIAGNILGPTELASVEYAIFTLGSSTLMVLGHENCGAVTAVLEGKTKSIEPLANLIAPAIKEVKKGTPSSLEEAIKANVQGVLKQLRADPLIADLLNKKALSIVGGYYKIGSGEVELLK